MPHRKLFVDAFSEFESVHQTDRLIFVNPCVGQGSPSGGAYNFNEHGNFHSNAVWPQTARRNVVVPYYTGPQYP